MPAVALLREGGVEEFYGNFRARLRARGLRESLHYEVPAAHGRV
jgi:hypothetical protein